MTQMDIKPIFIILDVTILCYGYQKLLLSLDYAVKEYKESSHNSDDLRCCES